MSPYTPHFVQRFCRYSPIFRHITLWQELIRRSTDPRPISTRLPAFESPFPWLSYVPKIGTIGSPVVAQSCLPATLPPPTSFLNSLPSYLRGFWAILDDSSTIWFVLRSPFHPHHCHTTDAPPPSPVVIGFQLCFPLSFLLLLGQWRHLVAFHWCHNNANPASLHSWQHLPNAASQSPSSIPLWLLSKVSLHQKFGQIPTRQCGARNQEPGWYGIVPPYDLLHGVTIQLQDYTILAAQYSLVCNSC